MTASLGNVPIGRSRLFHRQHPGNFRRAVANRCKDQTVIPPETFSAAYWLQKKNWQDKPFGKSSTARAETYFTAAIPAPIGMGKRRIGGLGHRYAPRNELADKAAAEQPWLYFTLRAGGAELRFELHSVAAGCSNSTQNPAYFPQAYTRFLVVDNRKVTTRRIQFELRLERETGTEASARRQLGRGGTFPCRLAKPLIY
jgi:hypothetical protein